MIKNYESKYDNYDISQRMADLANIVEIQCSKGNYDQNEYMRGMANGLLLAWYIIREPYGATVPFFNVGTQKPDSSADIKKLNENLSDMAHALHMSPEE